MVCQTETPAMPAVDALRKARREAKLQSSERRVSVMRWLLFRIFREANGVGGLTASHCDDEQQWVELVATQQEQIQMLTKILEERK